MRKLPSLARTLVASVVLAAVWSVIAAPGAHAAGCLVDLGCKPPDPIPAPTVPAPAPSPAPQPQPEPQPQPQPQPAPAPSQQPQPSSGNATVSQDPAAAAQLLDLINAERGKLGLAPVARRDDIAAIATQHSDEQARRGDIWHNDAFFTRDTKARLGARTVGENVAVNGSVSGAHKRLMSSPGHRANIVSSRYSLVGIAVARAANGQLYVTQNFVEPLAAAVSATAKRAANPAPLPARAVAPTTAARPAVESVAEMAAPPAPLPDASVTTPNRMTATTTSPGRPAGFAAAAVTGIASLIAIVLLLVRGTPPASFLRG
jgi:uncharacterized protein YkwD